MDAEEIGMLRTSLREVLKPGIDGPALADLLDELGWAEVVAEDPATATTLLFAEHGRALANTPALDSVVLPMLGAGTDADGDGYGAACYPAGGAWVLLGRPADDALVAFPGGGSARFGDLDTSPLRSIDPDLGWLSVAGVTAAAWADGVTAAGLADGVTAAGWADGVTAAARRALAAELIGVTEEALRLAIEHTSNRFQFGAPIAAFQAVRHRLADGEVALGAARALLAVAFDEGGAVAAAAAKVQAARAHDLVSANAIQVCGAIGATMEHPLHRYVNRGFALDALLGDRQALAAELGAGVLRTGETPRLVEV